MTKRDEDIERIVEKKMLHYVVRVTALCVTVVSAVLTLVYKIGAWAYDKSDALAAAWNAFRGVK